MKNSVLILFLLDYVLCRNMETDFAKGYLDNYSSRKLQAIEDDVTLYVYTQAEPSGVEVSLNQAYNLTAGSPFNTLLQTVFYVHGWNSTASDEYSVLVRTALLGAADINLIIVQWDDCSGDENYLVSQQCVSDVGTAIGEFIGIVAETFSYPLSDFIIVGHCLGAHIAGFAGKYNNGGIGVIVGLDPAGTAYSQLLINERLNEDDAVYVQAIHTNALLYGVSYDVGDADFWPDGGSLQNSCGLDSECSHQIAVNYYAESVTNNAFYARKCSTYATFTLGLCADNAESLMGGYEVDTSALGDYYLNTNDASPYGQGDVV